jgi:hypothetical protein
MAVMRPVVWSMTMRHGPEARRGSSVPGGKIIAPTTKDGSERDCSMSANVLNQLYRHWILLVHVSGLMRNKVYKHFETTVKPHRTVPVARKLGIIGVCEGQTNSKTVTHTN